MSAAVRRRIALAALLPLLLMTQSGLAQATSPGSALPAQTRQVATAEPGVFKQISAGWNFACGLRKGGSAACWGDSLQNGRFVLSGKGPAPGVFSQIRTGDSFACGLRTTGMAACWGGLFGLNPRPPSGAFTQISASSYFACGLRTTGAAVCWGDIYDAYGHVTKPPPGAFTDISAGYGSACGLRPNGSAVCWSVGGFRGAGVTQPPPGRFSEVTAGYRFACGLRTNGSALCWGHGAPSPPSGTFTHLSVGGGYACGLRSSGRVVCWGVNTQVQPKPPTGRFTQISAGYGLACGLRSSGAAACWGVLTAAAPAPLPTNPVAAVKTLACQNPKVCPPRTLHNKGYVFPCYRGGLSDQWSPRLGCPVTTRLQSRLIALNGDGADSICRCQMMARDVTVRVVRTKAARTLVNVNYHWGSTPGQVITFVAVKQAGAWVVANTYCAGKPNTTIFGKLQLCS